MILTRKQLQADLDAAKKREEILRQENERYRASAESANAGILRLIEERDDWRFAFRTLCKVVAR